MEVWDIYDENRIKTGRTIERGSILQKGEYHQVVHVCIFNRNGEMLIQQRQSFKQGWPDLWDLTVGGSAITGESSQEGAEREVLEEIGYHLSLKETRPHFTINFERGFDDFYLIEAEPDLNALKLQPEEVQRVKWASREEILHLHKVGEFVPHLPSLISLIFEIRKTYSSLQKVEG